VVTGELLPQNNMKEPFSAKNTWESSSEGIIQAHGKGKATVYGCLTAQMSVQLRKEEQLLLRTAVIP